MGYIFDFDEKLCSACGACAVACMDQNDTDAAFCAPYRTVRVIERRNGEKRLSFESAACRHCENAPCIAACPSGCIEKDAETGMTVWDNSGCTGCRGCIEACPFGVPAINGAGRMEKCHGCAARLKNGLMPACVHTCPTGALKIRAAE